MSEILDETIRAPQTEWPYAVETTVAVYGVGIKVELIFGRPKSLILLKSWKLILDVLYEFAATTPENLAVQK